jgi:tetratricopeptide (TPR) repeat protein
LPSSPRTCVKPLIIGLLMAVSLCLLAVPSSAGDVLSDARERMRRGDYAGCVAVVDESKDVWNRDAQLLRLRALMITGPAIEAAKAADQQARRWFRNVEALMLMHDTLEQIGQGEAAASIVAHIQELSQRSTPQSWSPADRVAMGRAMVLVGEEPKRVLDLFYKSATTQDPTFLPGYLAAGELALSKNDYALAAQFYNAAAKRDADDPDVRLGLARCTQPDDRVAMLQHLEAALRTNPNHVGSLLLKAEHEIDTEGYEQAAATLDRVAAINAELPELWCFRAVLAHLAGDEKAQAAARAKALEPWPGNPAVDHLIGRKLSDKYRFAEGAEHQRRALALAPKKLPATIQLAQDLLRLGQEKNNEGWDLVEHVAKTDGYNVVAHNLATLRRHLNELQTIENERFVVRMDPREAQVYGAEVMALLDESARVLCGKYGLQLDGKITVEIYPEQQDFAIRTFGVPGGAGYLGVCFGKVITMNSPAGLSAGAANWRSVLWHEFCHTVTLHMTRNRMPRWLSEGISVHEELQRDPSWGQRMTPEYRRMVLKGELSPLGKMSGAFLNPPSSRHLLFAYYQSALAVEFLTARYGQDRLRAILTDLGKGSPINTAITAHTAPLTEVEAQFKEFVHARALAGVASPAVFAVPDPLEVTDPATVVVWAEAHPESYWAQRRLGDRAAAANDWAGARTHYERALALDSEFVGEDSVYVPLAEVCKRLGDAKAERATWTQLAARSPTATTAFAALMALAEQEENWAEAGRLADQMLAVNPMLVAPRRTQARAGEAAGRTTDAITAYTKLLALAPVDAANVRFRLGSLLAESDPPRAKRLVLDALAEAPRFRDAHALLLRLTAEKTP